MHREDKSLSDVPKPYARSPLYAHDWRLCADDGSQPKEREASEMITRDKSLLPSLESPVSIRDLQVKAEALQQASTDYKRLCAKFLVEHGWRPIPNEGGEPSWGLAIDETVKIIYSADAARAITCAIMDARNKA